MAAGDESTYWVRAMVYDALFPTLDACLSEAFVGDSSSLVACDVPA